MLSQEEEPARRSGEYVANYRHATENPLYLPAQQNLADTPRLRAQTRPSVFWFFVRLPSNKEPWDISARHQRLAGFLPVALRWGLDLHVLRGVIAMSKF